MKATVLTSLSLEDATMGQQCPVLGSGLVPREEYLPSVHIAYTGRIFEVFRNTLSVCNCWLPGPDSNQRPTG